MQILQHKDGKVFMTDSLSFTATWTDETLYIANRAGRPSHRPNVHHKFLIV